MSAVKALQQWCRLRCEGYRDVTITNMTTSFRDGLVFCALIHKHRPDLIDYDSLKKDDVYENNKLAFRVAEEELGIPALLDAEDMVAMKVPDRLSILTYVSQYYNYFHGRSPIGGMGAMKRPAEPGPTTDQPSGKKNQPVSAKVFASPQPARENSPPPSSNITSTRPSPSPRPTGRFQKPARENSPPPSSNITRPSPSPKPTRKFTKDVPVERPHHHPTGTLSNKCVSCDKHVHLVQRHLVDGKLYHRSCAKLLSPTNSTGPFKDLPQNTALSKFTPLPEPPKTSTPTPTPAPVLTPALTLTQTAPSRPGPSWLREKPSSPPSFSSTFSTPPPRSGFSSAAAKESLKPSMESLKPSMESSRLSKESLKPSIESSRLSKESLKPFTESKESPKPKGSPKLSKESLKPSMESSKLFKESLKPSMESKESPKPKGSPKLSKGSPKLFKVSLEPSVESSKLSKENKESLKPSKESQESPKPKGSPKLSKESKESLKPSKESPKPSDFKPATSWTASEPTFVSTRPPPTPTPTPTPRTSTTAAKTVSSRLRFFQSDASSTDNEEKKKTSTTTTTVRVDVNKAPLAGGKVQEVTAGQAVTVVLNVGGDGKKEATPNLDKVGPSPRAAVKVEKVSLKPEDGERDQTKTAAAAAFISKKRFEENISSKPPLVTVTAAKETDKPSQVETPKRETPGARGRVKLRADPTLLGDLQPLDTPPTAAPRARTPDRGTPDRGGPKPSSPSTNTSASDVESPADWRSLLKPVGKETKPTGPQSTAPWANGEGKSKTSSSTSHVSAPSITVAPTPPKGFLNGQRKQTANGTTSQSKTPKVKPDYIPKEQIMKELQDIEDNLNELEKRGVELEVGLRRSEDEGEDDSHMDELMVEWLNLIRNKQVAIRRESELVYIGRTQDLEEQQPSVELELRRLMEKPERLKSAWERKREQELMDKLVEIVNDRNAIVDGLDEDRLREEEEDEQLNKMMLDFNVKKDKPKKKSPVAKLFGWGKKEG